MSPPAPARRPAGFTLTEVMVAIGVVGVAFAAILPVIPTGMRNVGNASDGARALDSLEAIRADIAAGLATGATASPRFAIPFDTDTTLGIADDGEPADDARPARFSVRCTFAPAAGDAIQPVRWHLRATWPATARPGKEQGAAELTGARAP